MTPLPFWRRYARFFGSDPAADVKDELRFHLEAKTDDLIGQGWHPEAARKEAEPVRGEFFLFHISVSSACRAIVLIRKLV